MEGFSTSIFRVTLGWLRSVARLIWDGISNPAGYGFFSWVGDHWKILAIILCVVGMGLDLTVYLIRWQPIQVWKSFFRRRRAKKLRKAGLTGDIRETGAGDITPEPYTPRFASNRPDADLYKETDLYTENDDLERWRRSEDELPENIPYEMTPAGYSVPMDSPYRRPPAEYDNDRDNIHRSQNLERTGPTRRRKRSLSGIFGNSDEEAVLYEPPRPVIDSREAYHAPVYPRNWRENGDKRS